ncbi:hypothetical protein Slala03_75470 [Streptomyces lavendulae subsp. lavendulae]|nr:hypothetical protein Slala03_75470 [Streptomyces lavendulae subsp. lavendulae]
MRKPARPQTVARTLSPRRLRGAGCGGAGTAPRPHTYIDDTGSPRPGTRGSVRWRINDIAPSETGLT